MEPWALLQLADSAFPTGGFAHSAGLEAAQQLGRLHGPEELSGFVEEALWSAGSFNLPFVRAARATPDVHAAVDAVCDAATPGHVANRASRDQGQAFLRAAAIFSPATSRLAEETRRLKLPGHLAPAFGAVLGLLGAQDEDTCRVFLYLGARGIFSAAVRLGIVGPIEAQALLAHAAPTMTAVLAACHAAGPADAASTSPVVDLLQGHQDRLYSRLFRS
jgi:urease accessory protein